MAKKSGRKQKRQKKKNTMKTKYYDGSEPPQELGVGDTVYPYGATNTLPGKIVEITEVDADYDDYLQRPVQYGPYVQVHGLSVIPVILTALVAYV